MGIPFLHDEWTEISTVDGHGSHPLDSFSFFQLELKNANRSRCVINPLRTSKSCQILGWLCKAEDCTLNFCILRAEMYSKSKSGEVAWLIRVNWCANAWFFHAVETGATDVMLESRQCCSNFYFEAHCSAYVERLRHAFSSLRVLAAWVFVICFRGQANSWNGLNSR